MRIWKPGNSQILAIIFLGILGLHPLFCRADEPRTNAKPFHPTSLRDISAVQNEHVRVIVRGAQGSGNAQFAIGGKHFDQDDPLDEYYNILYKYFSYEGDPPELTFTPEGSFLRVKIGDDVFKSPDGQLQNPVTTITDQCIVSTWTVGYFEIKQILRPVDLEDRGSIKITYQVINNSSIETPIGVMFVLDLYVGGFYIPGVAGKDDAWITDGSNFSRRIRHFEGIEVPSFWQSFEYSPLNPQGQFPGLIAHGDLSNFDLTPPDLFVIGNSFTLFPGEPNLTSVHWDYVPPTGTHFYNDSGVLLQWNQQEIAPGDTLEVCTMLGNGRVAFDGDDLLTAVTSPNIIQNIDCHHAPREFDINVSVTSLREIFPFNNLQAELVFPNPLPFMLETNNPQILNPSSLEYQETATAQWHVRIDSTQVPADQMFPFEVHITTSVPQDSVVVIDSIFVETTFPAIDLPEASHDYGMAATGDTIRWRMPLKNKGGTDVLDIVSVQIVDGDVTSFRTDFTDILTLPECGTDSVTINFSPLGDGDLNAIIRVADEAGNLAWATVSGRGESPTFVLEPSTHVIGFGEVDVGESITDTLVISNLGHSTLRIENITSSDPENFVLLLPPGGFPYHLEPNPTDPLQYDFSIRFQPQANQYYEGEIHIRTNDPQASDWPIAVTGTGIGLEIEISPTATHFGFVPEGTTTVDSVIIRNVSAISLYQIESLAINNPAYSLPENWNGMGLVPGDSAVVRIAFTPLAPIHYSAALTGTIRRLTGNPTTVPVTVSLDGDGWGPYLTMSNQGFDFNFVKVSQSADTTLTITSRTDKAVQVFNLHTNSPSFSFEIEGQPGLDHFTLTQPIESKNIIITFAPLPLGEVNGALLFETTDMFNDSVSVALTGFGQGPRLEMSPPGEMIDFGLVPLAETAETTLTLHNTGNDSLGIAQIQIIPPSPVFDFQPPETFFYIPPGDFNQISIYFAPDAGLTYNAAFQFLAANEPFVSNPVTIQLRGQGSASALILAPLLDFGSVRVNTPAARSTVLSNVGSAPTLIEAITVNGPDFELLAPHNLPLQLPGNDSLTIQLRFQPTQETFLIDTLWVENSTLDPLRLVLTGSGVLPHLAVNLDTDTLYFDTWFMGLEPEPPTANLSFSNSGTMPLSITHIDWPGEPFILSNEPPSTPFDLMISEEITWNFEFAPDEVGAYQSSLVVISDDPDAPERTIIFNGEATSGAEIAVSATEHDFGFVGLAEQPVWDLIIRNESGQILEIERPITTSNAHFVPLISGTGAILEVAPLDSAIVRVQFFPDEVGVETGELTIYSNDSDESDMTISLLATVVSVDLAVSVSAHDFGPVRVGTTARWPVAIINHGLLDLILADVISSQPHFSVDPGSIVPDLIPPWQSRIVWLQFSPDEVIEYSGIFTIQTNAPVGDLTIDVSGCGVAPSILMPTAHDFGSVRVGETAGWLLPIQNDGGADVVVTEIVSSSLRFICSADLPLTIAAQSELSLPVTFAPITIGQHSAMLTFSQDIPQVSLFGLGTTAQIAVSETYHDFGTVFDYADWDLIVFNHGAAPLTISAIEYDDPHFSLEPVLAFPLVVNDSAAVTIRYTALGMSPLVHDFIVIHSDDPGQPQVAILVRGRDAGVTNDHVLNFDKNIVLFQNRPNPFSGQTMIQFSIPNTQPVNLQIFNLTGQLVRTLVQQNMSPGSHVINWDGRDERGTRVAGGLYFYRLATPERTLVKRMVYLK